MSDLEIVCKGLLFDMDGVLVDSTHAVARVWKQWAIERGFDPDHVAHIAQGRPSITTIRELLPHADHHAENRIVERREIADVEGIVPCSGALELLDALPSDRWVLVTSSTRPLAEVRLKAGRHKPPKHMVTSSDIRYGKPHPEPFLMGAERLGLDPSDCVVVEDSPAGIQSGKAAGCRVLALRTTMPESLLEAANPDWIVDSCANVSLNSVSPLGELRLVLCDVRSLH